MSDLDSLISAVLAHPAESTLRGMLQDELIAVDCWEWSTLLGLVHFHPESDGLRLLAADWLETDGQGPQAEFIRLQCGLAILVREHGEAASGGPEYHANRTSLAAIVRPVYPALTQGLLPLPNLVWELTDDGRVLLTSGDGALEYERGFISRCLLDSTVFPACAGELFRNHPVSSLRVIDKTPVRVAEGWWWADSCLNPADPVSRRGYVPPDLYEVLLECDQMGRRRSVPRRAADLTFATQDAAIAALSRACLAYGRLLVRSDPFAREGIPEPARKTLTHW